METENKADCCVFLWLSGSTTTYRSIDAAWRVPSRTAFCISVTALRPWGTTMALLPFIAKSFRVSRSVGGTECG